MNVFSKGQFGAKLLRAFGHCVIAVMIPFVFVACKFSSGFEALSQVNMLSESQNFDSGPILPNAYPTQVYYLPVGKAKNLQSALDTYKIVRLDPNADYSASGLSQITIHSGYKLYGLSGTVVPPIVIASGTSKAVLSHITSASVTFPSSSLSTHDNVFISVKSGLTATNVNVENNLFLDWFGGLHFDDRGSGHLRNNRFIRVHAQGGYNPYLQFQGNATDASYQNTFLFYSFLTPAGDGAIITGMKDISFVGVDAESWSWNGLATHAVIYADDSVGTLRFFIANGGDNIHASSDPGATGYFDVGAKQFLLFNESLSSAHNPTIRLSSNVSEAVMLNVEAFNSSGFSYQQDNSSMFLYHAPTPATASASLSANDLSHLVSAMIDSGKNRSGQAWETPSYDVVPDPGGSNWNTNLANQTDSTSYIQGLIDAAGANGFVFLPAGTYYISSPLRLLSTQGLIGAGMDKTLIIAKDPSIDMIVGADHLSTWTAVGFNLSDLTLQGGTNGVHLEPNGSGKGAQYTNAFLSHVTFRNMSNAGIFFDSIVAFDNNLFDHLNFVNNGTGFLQRVDPSYTGGDVPGISYMDKTMCYACQFISNNVAVHLPAYRQNNLNAWVNNLFKDNSQGAFIQVDCVSNFVANSDFVNNGGVAVMQNDGHNMSVVGSRFFAGDQGVAIFSGNYSVEGSSFSIGNGYSGASSPQIVASSASVSFYNSSSTEVPLGTLASGFLFNNYFSLNSALSAQGVVQQGGVSSTLLTTPVTASPQGQLLFGSQLLFPY